MKRPAARSKALEVKFLLFFFSPQKVGRWWQPFRWWQKKMWRWEPGAQGWNFWWSCWSFKWDFQGSWRGRLKTGPCWALESRFCCTWVFFRLWGRYHLGKESIPFQTRFGMFCPFSKRTWTRMWPRRSRRLVPRARPKPKPRQLILWCKRNKRPAEIRCVMMGFLSGQKKNICLKKRRYPKLHTAEVLFKQVGDTRLIVLKLL